MPLIVLLVAISHLLILMVQLMQVLILSIWSCPILLYFSSVSPQAARIILYKVLYMHKKTKNLPEKPAHHLLPVGTGCEQNIAIKKEHGQLERQWSLFLMPGSWPHGLLLPLSFLPSSGPIFSHCFFSFGGSPPENNKSVGLYCLKQDSKWQKYHDASCL